jgi:eukaryotic-like serine/threonine-protein kinase
MAIDSVAAFADVVRQSQLLEPIYVNEFGQDARRFTDVRALAQHLIKQNRLTPYQVNQILQGQVNGLVLGQYRLLERLGEGGMGQVFKARHQTMGRIVAIKVIRKDRLGNANLVKRFHREIQLAAQLTHPNVVLAFDADQVGGNHFFAMEYVDGIDLSRLIKQNGALPVATACEYIRQAALGLQHAHERGLVHRDIKPGNLLVTKGEPSLNGPGSRPAQSKRTGGQVGKPLVKILDMGLARVAFAEDEATGMSITNDGTVMGTPDFMAPEQAKNSSMVDWRADIYSLGCTLYYLLTGSVPFPGGSNIEKLLHHQMDSPRSIEQIRTDVPAGVRAIVNRLMAKRVEDRIQSAGEIAHQLAPFCDGNVSTAKLKAMATVPSAAGPATVGAKSSTFAAFRNLFFDPQTRRIRQVGVLIGVVALVGMILMFVLVLSMLSGWAKSPTTTSPAVASVRQTGKAPPSTPAKPPPTERRQPVLEPLVRCLPDGVSSVCTYRVQDFVRSGVFKQNDGQIKSHLADLFITFQQYGINLYNDVDRASYAILTRNNNVEGVILLQGTFDTTKFQQVVEGNPQQYRARRPGKLGATLYEILPAPGEKVSRYISLPNANTFVYSTDVASLFNVLLKVTGQRAGELNDKEVQRQLADIDEKPTIFIVIGGTYPGADNQPLNTHGIRSMTAGFKITDDVQGEFAVHSLSAAVTQEIIRDNHMPNLVGSALRTILGDNGILAGPLSKAAPTVTPGTNIVTVRARYPATDVTQFFQKQAFK